MCLLIPVDDASAVVDRVGELLAKHLVLGVRWKMQLWPSERRSKRTNERGIKKPQERKSEEM